jgi:transcriptional regulator with XRE-family HTH domain
MKKVVDMIKAIRSSFGISQSTLACILGATQRTLTRWENRLAMPRSDSVSKIEKLYFFSLIQQSIMESIEKLNQFGVFDLSLLSNLVQHIRGCITDGEWPWCEGKDEIYEDLKKISLLSLARRKDVESLRLEFFSSYSAKDIHKLTLQVLFTRQHYSLSQLPYVFQLQFYWSHDRGNVIYGDLSDLFLLYISYILYKKQIDHAYSTTFVQDNNIKFHHCAMFGMDISAIFSLVDQFLHEKSIDFSFLFTKYLKPYLKK